MCCGGRSCWRNELERRGEEGGGGGEEEKKGVGREMKEEQGCLYGGRR